MKMNFSQRMGLEPKDLPIQRGSINDALKNCLWNILFDMYSGWIVRPPLDFDGVWTRQGQEIFRKYWHDFFKEPLDKMPTGSDYAVKVVREKFFKFSWNKVYQFVEFTADNLDEDKSEHFRDLCNFILERENSAYRFVGEYIDEIVSKEEIKSIEASLKLKQPYKVASTHFESALSLLSNKEKPNYRNSIKESISAVEAVAKIITNQSGATLGDVLKIKSFELLHPALKDGLKKIYGYTSDADGIRHALIDDDKSVTADEARFMLILCSAFVNYLTVKAK